MSKVKKKAPAKKPSTELARRPIPRPRQTALIVNDPNRILPQVGTLGDEAAVGVLGQVEVKLTRTEEAALSEAVDAGDVRMKPSGQPYLSHPAYTKWFNRAFGRLGWAIVPQSKPIKTISGRKVSVVCPYMLYIHGQPAAFAMGEQEYFEDSNEQTYGDALEATVASALRRTAKRLGVGLELWDKRWLQAFIDEHCVAVQVKKPRDDKAKQQWRRKDDQRLPWEITPGGKQAEDPPWGAGEEPVVGELVAPKPQPSAPNIKIDPKVEPKITLEQRKRIGVIVKNTGRNEPEVRLWLKKTYGITKGEDILRKDYQKICDQLQVRGTLPLPGDAGS